MRHIIIVSTCLTRRFCKGLQVAKGHLVLLDGITLANTVLASWLVVAIRHALSATWGTCLAYAETVQVMGRGAVDFVPLITA